jgi:hypothetical protein
MRKKIELDDKPSKLKIVIQTFSKEKLWIKVEDADRKNTYYTNRYAFVDGKQSFFVYMPQAPEDAIVTIYNDLNGRIRRDDTFKVLEVSSTALILPPLKASKKTKSFIKFAQEFADESGYLSATKSGDIYKSNNGRFRIDYFDVIRSHKTKRVVKTPARISQITGKIEVSAEEFRRYTIPMRMAILLHEYSHYYLNKNPSNESEADLNGLRLYLQLGYPKIDIYNVFLNVFKSSPSLQNKARYEKLDKLVKNFKR